MAITEGAREKLMLTQEQIDQYWEKGYCVVPDVLTEEEIERYKIRAGEIARGDYPPEAKSRIMKDVRIAKGIIPAPADPEKGLWKITNPDRFDETFSNYLDTPKLLDAAEGILGEDLLAFLLMFIYKPPNVNAVHAFHQDGFYFPFGPHDQVMGTWLPLDFAHGENGTLRVIPGSHRLDIQTHTPPPKTENAFTHGVQEFENHPDEEVLEVQPGHAVLFHSHLLHKTGGNSTDGHRRVLTVHMCSSTCKLVDSDRRIPEFGFRLVRGKNYPGCVLAPDEISVEYGHRKKK